MAKILSYSIWGDNLRYCEGAIINAELAAKIFADWIVIMHIGSSVPSNYKKTLEKYKNVQIVEVDEKTAGYGVFWRFAPMFAETEDIVLSRDADSRLSLREKKCVDEWLLSSKKFHIIRDHPRHFDWPIMAGMWGVKGRLQHGYMRSMLEYQKKFQYGMDQLFLANIIWPDAQNNILTHEIFGENWFAQERDHKCPIFCGQGFDENNVPIYPSW